MNGTLADRLGDEGDPLERLLIERIACNWIEVHLVEQLTNQMRADGNAALSPAKGGGSVNVLAVDYLGLFDTTNLDKTLYGQISRAARELKNLAKDRYLAVICLCQVSRANGEGGSSPLHIYSACESGAIEESADFLLGLYRPDLQGEDKTIAVQILNIIFKGECSTCIVKRRKLKK